MPVWHKSGMALIVEPIASVGSAPDPRALSRNLDRLLGQPIEVVQRMLAPGASDRLATARPPMIIGSRPIGQGRIDLVVSNRVLTGLASRPETVPLALCDPRPLTRLSTAAGDITEAAARDTSSATDSATPLDLQEIFARLRSIWPDRPTPSGGDSPFVFVRVRRARPSPTSSATRRTSPTEGLSPALRALIGLDEPRQELPREERAALEPVVGEDLRDVRLHTGPTAAATAAALGAEAFTVGRDIFFGQGRYQPGTPRGRALLAHELVHVRQQSEGIPREGVGTGAEARSREEEARRAEREALRFAAAGPNDGLSIGRYRRTYVARDGQPLSAADRARLDRISLRALEICRDILGAEVRRVPPRTIERIEAQFDLDLTTMSDDEAARLWAEAMAREIQWHL
jgi:hypothetical protein